MRRRYIWVLFVILFLASFDMHAQMPLLAPYARTIGATSMVIGILLGAYSISNLFGHLVAGPFLDRYSKKLFICVGLFIAGWLLIGHGLVDTPDMLMLLRLIFGFTMAFVTPACSALLGQLARNNEEQGVFMVKKGMVLTAAAIVSPAIGGLLAAKFGYAQAFFIFGVIMMLASFVTLSSLPNKSVLRPIENHSKEDTISPFRTMVATFAIYPAYVAGFAVMYAQGTFMYEIPLLLQRQHLEPTVSGILFSVMGLGSLAVLSQIWLTRTSPLGRIVAALFVLGLMMYTIAVAAPVSLYLTMFIIGACTGVLFPAMTTLLAYYAPPHIYGTAFSIYAAVLSIGSIISPLVAGSTGFVNQSFFGAFLVVTAASLIAGWIGIRLRLDSKPITR
ncbi:MFS transporter [Brevibacillus sp. B_LB10_24]|uniref:MFS transporter n=1 Tax=Brevibacillus sp. B_LB10_24 TaxID=3380645 RepID=UPI0038BCBB9E